MSKNTTKNTEKTWPLKQHFLMAKSTSLHISIGDAAAGAYTKQEIVSIPLKAVRCLLTGAKRKRKRNKIALFSHYVHALGFRWSRITDGSEKVERNAQVYQHSQPCRLETGTHTLTHKHQSHISKAYYSSPPKATNTNQSEDLRSLRPPFCAHLMRNTVSVC